MCPGIRAPRTPRAADEEDFVQRSLLALALTTTISFAVVADEVENYSKTIQAFRESPTVRPYFETAYGYAVFPTIGKGGVGVGGAYGKGQVYRAGKVTGTTSMKQLSIGLQFGGQAYSEIIFFEDQRAYNDFTSGKFEFGAQATAVAITASAQAQAGTGAATAGASTGGDAGRQTATWQNGMAVFTYAKGGLMYEASIGGQKFSFKPLQ
jgi:lipid-binding SYLF domain-containing protein